MYSNHINTYFNTGEIVMKQIITIMILSLISLTANAHHRSHHHGHNDGFIGFQISNVKIGVGNNHRGYNNHNYRKYKRFSIYDNHRPSHYHGSQICYIVHKKRRRRHHDIHTDYVENAYGDIDRIKHHTEYSQHAGEVNYYQKRRVNERFDKHGRRYTLPRKHWAYVHPHPSSSKY
jgi:hypothetical protein